MGCCPVRHRGRDTRGRAEEIAMTTFPFRMPEELKAAAAAQAKWAGVGVT